MPCTTKKIREFDKYYASDRYKKMVKVGKKAWFAFDQMKVYLEEFKVTKEPMSYAAVEQLFGGISREEIKEVIVVPCGSKKKKAAKPKGNKK